MKYSGLTLVGAIAVSLGAMALADGHFTDRQLQGAINARQAQMTLYSHNLGTLGAMAKGDIEYDAAAAQAAADNLAALSTMSQTGFWLPGMSYESPFNCHLPAMHVA